MKVDVVDFSGGGDGYTALYVDNKLHTYGDYYHDKIGDWINGWVAATEEQIGEENVERKDWWLVSDDDPLVKMGGGGPPKDVTKLFTEGRLTNSTY